ncbi:glycosyltransferase [Sphingomonas sp. LHG3406-1]|uniref:glycosyltransferase n=1 Tax=Sphingomonas sp. LHG3406-1 TaxID=2804617 RepID=UPI002629813F|nr:glycosyltransferase [Sphingomonas sp. LHG3406-1]
MAGKRQRIAVFIPDLGGGGAERVQLSVMKELVSRGHQVDLVLAFHGGALLELLPPEVRVFELRAPRLASTLLPLVRYLKKERPDALHGIMWPSTVIAPIAHLLAGSTARLMVSEQAALSQQYRRKRQRALLRTTARLAWPRADFRIACAAGTADDIAWLSRLPRSSFEVITNPTSPPEVIASTPEAEEWWGDADGRVITVGQMKAQKNHALLLRAFARLVGKCPAAKLMILGRGQLQPELEALAAELGIADRVIFPGFRLSPWPFLASADLFALSSDYEGLPLVLAEAMHAGLKVVSTDCTSGPRELLDGGRYGRLVPVGDAAALADAMVEALGEAANPERQRGRAEVVSGRDSIRRYADLLTGAVTDEPASLRSSQCPES